MFDNLVGVTHVAKIVIYDSKWPMLVPLQDNGSELLHWSLVNKSWEAFVFNVKYTLMETITYDKYKELTKEQSKNWIYGDNP